MWRILLILIHIIFILCYDAAAWHMMIVGSVSKMDIENGRLWIRDIETDAEIVVHFEPEMLSENVEEGELIRIWGEYDPENESLFHAQFMRCGCPHGRGNDPTGVRSRLGRMKGSGHGSRKGMRRGAGGN